MNFLLIASRPRSGTHCLKSALGSCPGVSGLEEEPFHDRWRGCQGFWDGETDPEQWLRERSAGSDWCVFCAHPNHYDWSPLVLPALIRIVTHVVCLYRRDHLASHVSYRLADEHFEWRTVAGLPPAHGTLTVGQERLSEWARLVRDSLDLDLQRWSDRPCRLLAYEDLVADIPGTLREIGEWAGIDTTGAEPATARHELRPLWEVVENYQAARQWAAELAIA